MDFRVKSQLRRNTDESFLTNFKQEMNRLKYDKRVFIPVVLVTLVFLGLALYSYYERSLHPIKDFHDKLPKGVRRPEGSRGGFDFTLLGNIAIALGAISYWWFLFKKKLASPSKPLKKWGKRLYSVHTYTGYTALILVIIHGSYYLVTKLNDPKILTGIAAFVIMLALATYGYLYRRVKNKFMRTSHFMLSNIWLVALFIHAGGFFFFMVVVTIALWAVIHFIDKKKKQQIITAKAS